MHPVFYANYITTTRLNARNTRLAALKPIKTTRNRLELKINKAKTNETRRHRICMEMVNQLVLSENTRQLPKTGNHPSTCLSIFVRLI